LAAHRFTTLKDVAVPMTISETFRSVGSVVLHAGKLVRARSGDRRAEQQRGDDEHGSGDLHDVPS